MDGLRECVRIFHTKANGRRSRDAQRRTKHIAWSSESNNWVGTIKIVFETSGVHTASNQGRQ